MHSTIHAVCGQQKGKNRDKKPCVTLKKKKKKKKKKKNFFFLVSRYLGHDTIHVSPAQVSRCIDASMHRYALNAYASTQPFADGQNLKKSRSQTYIHNPVPLKI